MNPLSIKPLYLGIAAAFAFGAGWQVNGWRLHTQIAEIKATAAEQKAKDTSDTVTVMQADAKAIHNAATELSGIQVTLGPKLDAIRKDLKNAKPLPRDCGPDPVRVRSLEAAIEAANAAAAGR